MTKNIAIIGGTFNPIHNGHLDMIKYIIDNNIADEVWVLPSYDSPHKNIDTKGTFEDRVNMIRLAIRNLENVFISTFEEDYYKKYNSKTYTYNILNELKKIYPKYTFHFVVGFDSIKYIDTWHEYKFLLRDYSFYIFDREDNDYINLEQKNAYIKNLETNLKIILNYKLFDIKITNISSSEIRKMVKINNVEELSKYLNKDVISYIKEHKLYE